MSPLPNIHIRPEGLPFALDCLKHVFDGFVGLDERDGYEVRSFRELADELGRLVPGALGVVVDVYCTYPIEVAVWIPFTSARDPSCFVISLSIECL